jgi:hypothetical protein
MSVIAKSSCPSCGVAWEKHLGIAGTCKQLENARQLLADICNHEVNPEDEAEKWLRAYGWPNVRDHRCSPGASDTTQKGN